MSALALTRYLMAAPVAAVVALAVATPALSNDGVFARYFDHLFGATSGYVCFNRIYDEAHLNTHPKQNVATMMLIVNYEQHGDEIHFRLDVDFRKPKSALGAVGICEGGPAGKELKCYVLDMGGELDVNIAPDRPALVSIPKPVNVWKDTLVPPSPEAHGPFQTDDRLFQLERWTDARCAALVHDPQVHAKLMTP